MRGGIPKHKWEYSQKIKVVVYLYEWEYFQVIDISKTNGEDYFPFHCQGYQAHRRLTGSRCVRALGELPPKTVPTGVTAA
jgi:hypothetical protein